MSINNFGVKLKRYPTAEQEFPWNSWRDIRFYLTTDEIKLIADLSDKFNNNQIEELPETIFKIVLKYIVHSRTYQACDKIFLAIENHYKTDLVSALQSLIRYDIIESNNEKQLWVLLKEQEDQRNSNRNEQESIATDVISKSFEKYYDIYSKQFGFAYQSPNSYTKSNYGSFLTSIVNHFKDNGAIFDLKKPWSKSYQDYRNEIYQKRFGESAEKTINTPKVSKLIKDLLNTE